jgi:hypothetical protein
VTFTHGYGDNDGLLMYYEVHGLAVAGQPPLLPIPGGGSTIGTNFSEHIPLLTEQRQVIAVEEEGHGRTQPTSRPLTAENSDRDVATAEHARGLPASSRAPACWSSPVATAITSGSWRPVSETSGRCAAGDFDEACKRTHVT